MEARRSAAGSACRKSLIFWGKISPRLETAIILVEAPKRHIVAHISSVVRSNPPLTPARYPTRCCVPWQLRLGLIPQETLKVWKSATESSACFPPVGGGCRRTGWLTRMTDGRGRGARSNKKTHPWNIYLSIYLYIPCCCLSPVIFNICVQFLEFVGKGKVPYSFHQFKNAVQPTSIKNLDKKTTVYWCFLLVFYCVV